MILPDDAVPLPQRVRLCHTTVPLPVGTDSAPLLFDTLFNDSSNAVWLDNSSSPIPLTHSSTRSSAHASPQPRSMVMVDDSGPWAQLLVHHIGNAHISGTATAFDQLEAKLAGVVLETEDPHTAEALRTLPTDFALGWIVMLGYELRHELEPAADQLAGSIVHSSELPDALALFADRALILDCDANLAHLLALAPGTGAAAALNSIEETQQAWLQSTARTVEKIAASATSSLDVIHTKAHTTPAAASKATALEFHFDHSRAEYLAAIAEAQRAIAAGDTYEVCLTTTAQGPALADPWATYLRLRRVAPVPYGAYLRFTPEKHESPESVEAIHILSASPERFIQLDSDGRVEAQPIKGTRRRGTTPAEDAQLREDLASHPKDRAENLMIVDLLRNDLGRVCAPGSVSVPRIFEVRSFSHVHQLVSTITGTVRQRPGGVASVDLLRACFPGGSMTGAPKPRTMRIIDALERRARGPYSGSIGWLSLTGACDLSIVIRTLVATARATTFGVGGAIVADSDPDAEFEEILAKSSALVEALGARLAAE